MIGKLRMLSSGRAGVEGRLRRQGQETAATFAAAAPVKMIGPFGGIKP